jgi:hypothetical protein
MDDHSSEANARSVMRQKQKQIPFGDDNQKGNCKSN